MMGNEAIHDAHLKQAERQRDEARAEVERLRGALEAIDNEANGAVQLGMIATARVQLLTREALNGKESQ